MAFSYFCDPTLPFIAMALRGRIVGDPKSAHERFDVLMKETRDGTFVS